MLVGFRYASVDTCMDEDCVQFREEEIVSIMRVTDRSYYFWRFKLIFRRIHVFGYRPYVSVEIRFFTA